MLQVFSKPADTFRQFKLVYVCTQLPTMSHLHPQWLAMTHNELHAMQEARRRQKELEQVERQNAAAATLGPGPQATPHFAVPSARPHSARSARFAEGICVFSA